LAEQALVSDRLTTPIETSAYAYYQEALKLDPENSAAKLGMQRIAERYLAMTGLAETTDSMWTDAELKRATGLVKRAAWVAPSYTTIEWYESRLDQLVNNSTDSSSLEIGVGAGEGEEIPTTTTALVTAVGTVAGEDMVVVSESQVPKNSTAIIDPFGEQALNAEEAQLSVVTNTHWQDQQAVMQAKKLIAQGDALAAEVLLKKTLTHIETPTLSAAYLLELYSQQTRIHDFSALLEDVTYLSELDRQYFSAKQALLQGDELKAIELLEAQLAAAESHENYRALLAGLYQHSGQYVQASNSYRRLLASFGDKPAYWLGFALALDALNQKSSALQAYKRLDSYRELEAAVRDYIVQRIHALSSE